MERRTTVYHLLFLQQSDFQFIPSMKTLENMVDSANQLIFSHKNDLLDVLQETAEKLRVLQSVKSRKETGSEQSSNGRRRSAGLHTRLSRSSGHFVSFTPSVCVLREVLCGTANTLTYTESQETTTDVGKCFMRSLGSL